MVKIFLKLLVMHHIHTIWLRTECEEDFIGTTGDIYSPNWGNGNYHDGHDCTWTIEVPAGNVVRAELVTFSLYASNNDTNDTVSVSSHNLPSIIDF